MFYLKSLLILFSIINSLSIQASTALEQVGQLSLSSKTYQVNGQYLYAASCGGFEVFDLIDPLKPNLLANLPLISTYDCTFKIAFNNSYVYILNLQHIDIIDISTPNKPKRVGNYEIPRNNDYSSDFIIAGNYGYLTISNEILVLDLSNPVQPSLVANKVFETGALFKTKVNGEQLVVRKIIRNYPNDLTDEILFFNLKKPTQFEQLGSISLGTKPFNFNWEGFPLSNLEISDQYLYTISLNGELLSIDISNPAKPQQVGKYTFNDQAWGDNYVFVSGKFLYFLRNNTGNESAAGDFTHKVFVMDISKPTQLSLTSTYKVDNNYYYYINSGFLYKQNFYVASRNGLPTQILDISQPSQLKEIGRLLDSSINWSSNLVHKGNTLYFIDGSNNKKTLVTIDISNPVLPKITNTINFDELINSYYYSTLAVDNNYLYFCNGLGLYSLDISNPLQPKKVGQHPLSNGNNCNDVTISGKYAYLMTSTIGRFALQSNSLITVVDISSPTQLSKVGEYSISNRYLKKLIARDEKVYVLAQSTQPGVTIYDYLHILDANTPTSLKELSNYELPISSNYGIALVGQYAYFSGSSRLHIVDVSNSNSPVAVGNYSNNSLKYSNEFNIVSTGNNMLYASDYYGLFKIDVSNPAKPKQIAQILPTFDYGTIAANEPYLYRLTSYGLQVFKSLEVEAPQMTQIKGLANGACELNLSAKMLNADDGTGKNAGDFYLQWKETGRESTSSGDAVIAGYFYAPSEKVTWGSEANPEVYAKLWFAANGMLNVNFFHVGVFDVQLGSSYGEDMPQLNGGSTLDHNKITIGRKAWRYSRHDYTNWRSCGTGNTAISRLKIEEVPRQTLKEMVNPKFTTSVFKSPSSNAAKININQQGSCELLMDAKMLNATSDGKPYGNLKLQWKEILRSTTSGGDTVIAGYFYGSPNEVSWGSTTNPEAYVKIWYARTGMLNVNFFHVGVFDIELTSSYKGSVPNGIDGYLTDDNNFINIWSDAANRYSRHDYNNWKLCN